MSGATFRGGRVAIERRPSTWPRFTCPKHSDPLCKGLCLEVTGVRGVVYLVCARGMHGISLHRLSIMNRDVWFNAVGSLLLMSDLTGG